MPGPAATMGSQTAHGGAVVLGFPTVLIGGKPAARLTDMHVCPMCTPAPVPVPHVGGPIVGPGVPTVLIGNMPAATMGDMAVCVGPPDAIVMGVPTVIIGMAGMGNASGGGGGGGGGAGGSSSGSGGGVLDAIADNLGFAKAAASAVAGAASALNSPNAEPATVEGHWIEFQFTDSAGLPVSGVPYEMTLPGGKKTEGTLNNKGRIRRGGVDPGQGKVVLMNVSQAKWSKDGAKAGDSVTMSAQVKGFEPGTKGNLTVYQRDLTGPDKSVVKIDVDVQGDKVEAPWELVPMEDEEPVVESADGSVKSKPSRYSAPQYYFEATVGPCTARSGLLNYLDRIEVEVEDDAGNPLKDEEYVLFLSTGEVRKGKLDGSGKLTCEDIPVGPTSLRLPNLPDVEIEV